MEPFVFQIQRAPCFYFFRFALKNGDLFFFQHLSTINHKGATEGIFHIVIIANILFGALIKKNCCIFSTNNTIINHAEAL